MHGKYFPITTFRLPDCPYSYQKGRLTSALTVCPYIAIYKTDIYFFTIRCRGSRGRFWRDEIVETSGPAIAVAANTSNPGSFVLGTWNAMSWCG